MKKFLLLATLALFGGAVTADTVSETFCRALNVEGLTFTTGGDALWTETTENSHDGTSALQSGTIDNYQSTWFQTTIEGPRLVSFMWMVSSYGRPVSVSCDGVEMRSITGKRMGWNRNYTTDWERQYVFIGAGTHVVRWTYSASYYAVDGEDLARIDELQLGPIQDEITLPSDLTALETYAFKGSTSLKSVTLPDSLASVPDNWFRGCTGLSEIVIPKSVASIGVSAFYECTGLKTVTFSTTNLTTIGDSSFQKCSALETVTVPETVTSLGASAFGECSSLRSARLPSGLTATPNGLFMECSSLSDVTMPTAPIKIEANTFLNCTSLQRMELPASVTTIGSYAFSGTSLKTFAFPDWVTEISDHVFANCLGLEKVTCSDNVTSIGEFAFSHCQKLRDFAIPASVTSIGAYAFYCCCEMPAFTLPEGLVSLSERCFSGCEKLSSITVPSTVKRIESYAFSSCAQLSSVYLPEGLEYIGSCAFQSCSSLKTLTIPSSVTEVGYWVFDGTDLQLVEFKGPPPTNIGGNSLTGRTIIPKAYGAAWIKALGIDNFKGFGTSGGGIFTVEVISSSIREYDPTVMDVVYKVTSAKPTVKVRVLAFEDGTRTFANVVRPETFVADTNGVATAGNVGDSVTPNVEHTISWRVSSDWQTKLAKLQIEVFACEGDLLPLEYMTIPASDVYGKMTVTWNAISERQWLDALFWLYASKDAGLKLEDGMLMRNDETSQLLVNGASFSGGSTFSRGGGWYNCYSDATAYVYGKMGYSLLADEALTYANDELRLGLSPSDARQYGYKIEQ